MSCFSTVTGTSLSTLSSESVSTSYSASVSSFAGTKSTVTSCGTSTFGFFPVPTCSTFETTIGGGATTLQIPVTTTVTLTQAITSTLYGTTCSGGSASGSTQTSAASSDPSSGSTASSTSGDPASSSTLPASTTILLPSTETTVLGGSTITTQITSMEVVAVTATSIIAASLPSGSSAAGNSSTPAGAIIGAIIGGIVALIVLAFGFAFFSRGKKQPGEDQEKERQLDMPTMAGRMLRKRRDKGDIDLDAEPRPYTEGLPYQGDISVGAVPPTPPQKDYLPMRLVSKLKPLPSSPRATWYSSRTVPGKPAQTVHSDRSSIATIRATPRATPPSQLPQLTVNPPSPPSHLLHVANLSPRNSALLTPPPLPEKSHFMPRPRRGKAVERQDGVPPQSRGHTPRTSLRASFFGTPSLRMPVPLMPAVRPIVQHEDGGPAQAGPSVVRRDKAAEAASEARSASSGDMPPPAYSA
ncbi:uncharacterized protein B0H18DRAFT_1118123 [Fomitopsis serialis]|uniref:uncharacterized protein n=1 Tax=Fomitopsis serialis TaxID=139415 RepID=UPI0020078654|nr:uncharacterized protein B0H18DRAFT_1118123 [Neoantrodia serialis]KAH9928102.1 hypothetical protein B0H18DRAFT_1118123 [Neoantrodia serialis]